MPISESLHAYWPDGRPAYEVPSVDGKKLVKTTVREMRRLGLYTSPSAVTGQLNKIHLINWFKRRSRRVAWDVLRGGAVVEALDYEVFETTCEEIEEAQTDKRDKGVEIHTAVEQAIRGEDFDGQYATHVARTMATLELYGPMDAWVPEETFSCPEFEYGGRRDIRNTSSGVIIDLKTRDFKDDKKPIPYPEEKLQLAAYRYPAGGGQCINLYIDRESGLAVPYEHKDEDIDTAWTCFKALLLVFQLTKGLNCPQITREAKAA